jgi:vesicle transport through interaction with t-SNAREs 1
LLQKNEELMAAQNDRLERARRTMQETEQVALEITEELGNNRETLTSAHGRIREVSGLTGRAKRVLNRMSQRALQQKMILYAVAIGLVVVFFLLLWMMWRR